MSQAQQTLAQRLLDGDKRALARAITLVESDDPAGWELVREVYPHTGNASIVGLTGAPGAGKSTLIGALTKLRREQDREIAVLSIDPSSPFTHGALLGDRIRLTEHFLDPGVFIRSMANRGALGGLSEAALQAALLMDAAGKDDVLPGDRRRRPGRGRHHRPRRHHRVGLDARLGRLDPGAEGRRHGDPRHHRRQQGRPPADRHDGPRDPRRAVARAAARLARADRQDRGPQGRRRRRAGRTARRAPRATSRPRARSRSAASATCAARSSRSAPSACAAGWRSSSTRTTPSPSSSTRSSPAASTPPRAASRILERLDAAAPRAARRATPSPPAAPTAVSGPASPRRRS